MRRLGARLSRAARHELGEIFTGASFVFACRMTGAAAVFVTQVLLARWIGPDSLGVYVYAFAWCMLLAVLAGLGLPAASARFLGKALAVGRGAAVHGYLRCGRAISLASALLVASLGTVAVLWTASPVYRVPLLLAVWSVLPYVFIRFENSVAYGLGWLRAAFLPEVVLRPLLVLGLLAALWWVGRPLTPAVVLVLQLAVMLLLAVFQTALSSRGLRRLYPHAAPEYETALWLRTALSLLFMSLYTNYFLELNLIVGGQFFGAQELAVYNASFRTAFIIGFGIRAVDSAIVPRLVRLHAAHDMAGVQRIVAHATQLRSLGAAAAAIAFVFWGRSVLGLFGAPFVEGHAALLWLAAAQVAVAAFGPAAALLSLTGHQRQCLHAFGVGLAALILLYALLAPRFGINGAALAVFLVSFAQSFWLARVAARELGVQLTVFSAARPG